MRTLSYVVLFLQLRKSHIVIAGIFFAFNGSIGASLPSGATTPIAKDFHVSDNDPRLVLLNSLYLVGFVVGPLCFGPLSECVGRRKVLIGTYLAYALFTMACALAPTFEALLVFRLFCGLNGSVPNAVLGGLYSDIYDDPDQRGRVMAVFMFTAIAGPMAGPLVSGFMVLLSWRWVFWVALIVTGTGVPFVVLLPETYWPVLEEDAKKKQKEKRAGHDLDLGDGDVDKPPSVAATTTEAQFSARRVFIRPYSMLFLEPIVTFTSLYLAVLYGILFLFFQAYPVVFEDLYELSNSINGLAYIPSAYSHPYVIFGAFLGLCLALVYALHHSKALAANQSWASVEEYRRLPLACVGAMSIVVALFWLGWTASKALHPVLPMMAGIFFGFGYLLVFIAMLNYLTDAYKEASASAQSAASATRALMAVVLPFATTPMYAKLGIHWASSLLGFVALALAGIPFAFIKYGRVIRQKSGLRM
ncbi:hypothetical protein AnigIFM63326_003679 [Aspergillus niger]|nr:hypothetical protein AnigIFM63326_003679 [Aspergillus niger]